MPETPALIEQVGPDLVRSARVLMHELLGEQRRMCGEFAHDHCDRVGQSLRRVVEPLGEPLATETVCGGLLHDVLEDAVDWNDADACIALSTRIATEYSPVVLRIVKGVTVDPRLSAEDQFAIHTSRAKSEYQVSECLVRLGDIHDNWLTRQVYAATYLSQWEKYARNMVERIIPGRLRSLGWRGSIPFALLEPPGF